MKKINKIDLLVDKIAPLLFGFSAVPDDFIGQLRADYKIEIHDAMLMSYTNIFLLLYFLEEYKHYFNVEETEYFYDCYLNNISSCAFLTSGQYSVDISQDKEELGKKKIKGFFIQICSLFKESERKDNLTYPEIFMTYIKSTFELKRQIDANTINQLADWYYKLKIGGYRELNLRNKVSIILHGKKP